MNEENELDAQKRAVKNDVRDVVFGLILFFVLMAVAEGQSRQTAAVIGLVSLAGLVFAVRGGIGLLGRLW